MTGFTRDSKGLFSEIAFLALIQFTLALKIPFLRSSLTKSKPHLDKNFEVLSIHLSGRFENVETP